MPKEKLTPGYYSQAADRARCMKVIFTDFLANFPPIEQDKVLSQHALNIISGLQAIQVATESKGSGVVNQLDDRAAWLCETVSDLLVEQPEIKGDKTAHKQAYSAMSRLWALYQHLAEKWFNTNPEPETIVKPKKYGRSIR